MKQIEHKGFTSVAVPDDKPCLAIYAIENCGKTRFGCTAPHDEGAIGFITIDKNSKRTIQEYVSTRKIPVLVSSKQYISDKQAIMLARMEAEDADGKKIDANIKKVQSIYGEALTRIIDDIATLVESSDVESIVLDTASQIFDYILFSHFGRKNQIESHSRTAPNQDMIDIINMLRNKNSVLIHKASEVWKETGERDKLGRPKKEPSGRYKPEGFSKIGGLVTAVLELSSKKLGKVDSEKDNALKMKYRIRVDTCKGNTLLEGRDLHEIDAFYDPESGDEVEGVSGEDITWPNVLRALKVRG